MVRSTPFASGLENSYAGSYPAISSNTARVSAQVRPSTEIVSISFTVPPPLTELLLTRPGVGFRPMMLLNAAGTRPEPAASLPNAKLTRPAATTTADPELEPPEM